MTPEWSRRAGTVLASTYWNQMDDDNTKDFSEFMRFREKELYPLKESIQNSDSYNDLSVDMKSLFDKIESYDKEQEELIKDDWGGYGRFHSTEENWMLQPLPDSQASSGPPVPLEE